MTEHELKIKVRDELIKRMRDQCSGPDIDNAFDSAARHLDAEANSLMVNYANELKEIRGQ